MVQKYQLENPNDARIYIDYRKEKDKVKFEYVGKKHPLSVCMYTVIKLMFSPAILLFLLPILSFFMIITSIAEPDFLTQMLMSIFVIDYFMIIVVGFGLILANTRLITWVPHIWSHGANKYFTKFIPEDIKDNKVEVPLFKNTFLEYKATETFSKYLERVEIIEHPFKKFKVLRKKKWKEVPQTDLWKAIFYFKKGSEVNSGELLVMFN